MIAWASEQIGKRPLQIGVALAIVAAFSFAATGLIANFLVDDGQPGVVVAFYEALVGLLLVLSLNARVIVRSARPSRATWLWTLAAALGFAAAFGSFYTALGTIDYSIGAPILGAVPLVSYIALPFVLRGYERLTRRAILGAVLIVVGVGIIGVVS